MKPVNIRQRPRNLSRNNLLLFLSILFLFFIGPIFGYIRHLEFLTAGALSLLIITSAFAMEYKKKIFVLILIFASVSVIIVWLLFITDNTIFYVLGTPLLCLYLLFVTVSLVYHIAISKNVNSDVIFSTINGYLLLGITGAILFLIIDRLNPGSLSIDFGPDTNLFDYVYLSFVTLTTLGYGDISPTINATRSLSIILAICGQFYMTILIAMLIGKFLNPNKS